MLFTRKQFLKRNSCSFNVENLGLWSVANLGLNMEIFLISYGEVTTIKFPISTFPLGTEFLITRLQVIFRKDKK